MFYIHQFEMIYQNLVEYDMVERFKRPRMAQWKREQLAFYQRHK